MRLLKNLAFSLLVIFSFVLSQATISFAEQPPNFSGYFTTKDGKTRNFIKIAVGYLSIDFKYGPEDKNTRLPLATLKEMTLGEKSTVARLIFKDGRRIDAKSRTGNWFGDRLSYYYFDDLQKKELQASAYWKDISNLIIDENVGRFKRCPFCKRNWPDSYLFCPHDGTQTVWGEPAGSIHSSITFTEEQKLQKSQKVMEAIVNESVAKQGADPSSDLSRKATDFATSWMNPLATKDEINKKLYDLRDAIVK